MDQHRIVPIQAQLLGLLDHIHLDVANPGIQVVVGVVGDVILEEDREHLHVPVADLLLAPVELGHDDVIQDRLARLARVPPIAPCLKLLLVFMSRLNKCK